MLFVVFMKRLCKGSKGKVDYHHCSAPHCHEQETWHTSIIHIYEYHLTCFLFNPHDVWLWFNTNITSWHRAFSPLTIQSDHCCWTLNHIHASLYWISIPVIICHSNEYLFEHIYVYWYMHWSHLEMYTQPSSKVCLEILLPQNEIQLLKNR